MASVSLFLFFFLCHVGLHSAEEATKPHPGCHPFPCGKFGEIKFPFTNTKRPQHCGLLTVEGCDNDTQKIQLEREGKWYEIVNLSQENAISIHDEVFSNNLHAHECKTFNNLSFPSFPFLSFRIHQNITLFKCNHELSLPSLLEYKVCSNLSIYYTHDPKKLPGLPRHCSFIQLPWNQDGNHSDIFTLLTADFSLEVHVSGSCWDCHYSGGDCQINHKGKFYCANLKGIGIRMNNGKAFHVC